MDDKQVNSVSVCDTPIAISHVAKTPTASSATIGNITAHKPPLTNRLGGNFESNSTPLKISLNAVNANNKSQHPQTEDLAWMIHESGGIVYGKKQFCVCCLMQRWGLFIICFQFADSYAICSDTSRNVVVVYLPKEIKDSPLKHKSKCEFFLKNGM